GAITTIAGGGTSAGPGFGDGGQARAATLLSPHHVAVVTGVLYVADNGHDRIRKVDLATGVISAFLSPGGCSGKGLGLVGCDGRSCSLANDVGSVLVGATFCGNAVGGPTTAIVNVYSDGTMTHVAGSATGTTAEGAAGTQTLITGDVFVGSDFHVYYAEPALHRIREVSTFDGVRTVVGTGLAGYGPEYGPAATAALDSPWAFTISSGALFIGDAGNGVVRYTRLR
ncbi:MAG: hypothetical protein L0Y66_06005, partial [Myxococcaceae bacterium]|nr:hypothetical protein [Myxococcaceae bacterium]